MWFYHLQHSYNSRNTYQFSFNTVKTWKLLKVFNYKIFKILNIILKYMVFILPSFLIVKTHYGFSSNIQCICIFFQSVKSFFFLTNSSYYKERWVCEKFTYFVTFKDDVFTFDRNRIKILLKLCRRAMFPFLIWLRGHVKIMISCSIVPVSIIFRPLCKPN